MLYLTNDSNHFHFARLRSFNAFRRFISRAPLSPLGSSFLPLYLSRLPLPKKAHDSLHSRFFLFPQYFTVTLCGSEETRGCGYAKILEWHGVLCFSFLNIKTGLTYETELEIILSVFRKNFFPPLSMYRTLNKSLRIKISKAIYCLHKYINNFSEAVVINS